MSRILRSIRPVRLPLPTNPPTRAFASTPTRRLPSSSFDAAPSPPRLPADQQAEFERLQREAEARLSTHNNTTAAAAAAAAATPQPSSQQPLQTSRHTTTPTSIPSSPASSSPTTAQSPRSQDRPAAAADGEEQATTTTFSGGIRKGAPPEFEGEVNPKTGEVGGPKNEPLRWGGGGDWSYNGRVTDF